MDTKHRKRENFAPKYSPFALPLPCHWSCRCIDQCCIRFGLIAILNVRPCSTINMNHVSMEIIHCIRSIYLLTEVACLAICLQFSIPLFFLLANLIVHHRRRSIDLHKQRANRQYHPLVVWCHLLPSYKRATNYRCFIHLAWYSIPSGIDLTRIDN